MNINEKSNPSGAPNKMSLDLRYDGFMQVTPENLAKEPYRL